MVTVALASADTLTRGGGRVDIPGLSMDGHSYSGMHGYSDKGGEGGGRVVIPGLSMDGHCYSGIRGYSDKGGGRVVIPGLSMDGHGYSGIHGYSDKGGGGGWTSLDYPWMVTVTLASADTLTRGGEGRVDIPGLSVDGHSYSQLSTKQLCPSMDGRGLSTAPLDISVLVGCVFTLYCCILVLY